MVYVSKLSACLKWVLSVYQNMLWKSYMLPLLDVLETVTSLNRMSLNPVCSAKVVCPFCHVTGSWAFFFFFKICILFFDENSNINTPEDVVVQVTNIFLVRGKTTPDKNKISKTQSN